MHIGAVALATTAIAPTAAGVAQPQTLREQHESRERGDKLGDQAIAAFNSRDYEAAESLLAQQIELQPESFVPLYNMACVLAATGDLERAEAFLTRALEKGFVDFQQLASDPHLAALREREVYHRLMAARGEIVEAAGESQFESVRKEYGPRYAYQRDEQIRVAYASAYDGRTLEQVREEIRLLTEWGLQEVFYNLHEPPMAEADPWVMVVLPNERDFKRWAIGRFGPAAVTSDFHRVGGSYSHDRKELVAMDLGGTLRHEFFHALHWRSCARLGQSHPLWVQEGLCSLVEDYDLSPDSAPKPAPSWRTNMLKRLERTGNLPDIADLIEMPRDRFTANRPLANYAMARAVFLYLHDRGKLGEWYRHYTEHLAEDPTGAASLEAVLAMPLDDVQADFVAWLRVLPEVAEARTDGTISGLAATLGVELDPGKGEGPVVRRVRAAQAQRAGLRPRDVITSLDGRPTRDLNELVRVLGEMFPGQSVELTVRRRDDHLDLTAQLLAP